MEIAEVANLWVPLRLRPGLEMQCSIDWQNVSDGLGVSLDIVWIRTQVLEWDSIRSARSLSMWSVVVDLGTYHSTSCSLMPVGASCHWKYLALLKLEVS